MKRQNIVHLTQTALMTAILIVLGMIPGIPLGFIPVPIVLQNMGVMMAGEILGPKEGTTSVALLLLLVAVGFPFLTGGSGGIAVFAGPTGGYLLAWLFAPLLIGSLRQHFGSRWSWWQEFFMIVLAGVLAVAHQADGGIDVQSGIYSWRPDQSRRGSSRCSSAAARTSIESWLEKRNRNGY